MSKQIILVTGANGQLGSELQAISINYPEYDFLFVTRAELPIDNAELLREYFFQHAVTACINCAAYTAVDKAETETELAFAVNGEAVGRLAAICKVHDVVFIHISTDYVFNGNADSPYQTDHPTDPVNSYGASKLKGEELALQHNEYSIIIRTSWVYSSFGNNFVKTMLRLMKDRESINVVNDQWGRPTYAADLAAAIMRVLQKKIYDGKQFSGLYHFSNSGMPITWYDFATAIKMLSASKCEVNPISSAAYPTPAKRPQYSVLDTIDLENDFELHIPEWRESLKKCLAILNADREK